jgi:LysR family hydrogen peroxide-inducible transcriptional activator
LTLTQLEYILAVDQHRHFAQAAKACFITQPTLSMQLHKLEEELGLKIFDRSKQPVLPTEQGLAIIEQARKIIAERDLLLEITHHKKDEVSGILRVGIIPTLAPYLLPLFINSFIKKFPLVKLQVTELNTNQLVQKVKEGNIDTGILVTPLQDNTVQEEPLFYEEMVAYVSKKNSVFQKNYVLPGDIDPNKLWLLEEGHCFRSQIANLCELKKKSHQASSFEYEAGSFETLRRMVDLYDGITVLPELALGGLSSKQKGQVKKFRQPAPVREVSMVVRRAYLKRKMLDALKIEILQCLPEKLKKNKNSYVVSIK